MKQSAGRRVILLLLAVWVAAAGCRRESPETGHVLFALQPAAYPGQTKSVVDEAAETKITSVLLAVYREGRLEVSRRYTSGQACSLLLSGNGSRTAYAFVNMTGLQEADLPLSEKELPSVTWRIGSYAQMDADGLPMAGSVENVPMEGTCPVPVSRLVSRFEFHLLDGYRSFFSASPRVKEHEDDPSWLLRNICYTLRNINGTLRPFGESVAHARDLLEDREFALTTDGSAVLYVPENLQGNLLKNDVPAGKDLPSLLREYGADYQVCASYVEVSLEQDPDRYGVGGSLSYRFFLGEDNVRNFSVGRNRRYEVGFGPDYRTVMQCYDNGDWPWKVGSDDWHDSRYLAFGADRYPVRKGAAAAVRVTYGFEGTDHPETAGQDWSLYIKYAGESDEKMLPAASHPALASFAEGTESGIYQLKPSSTLPGGTQLEMIARTYDGRLEARSCLMVLPGGELVTVWDCEPRYIAQVGTLSLQRDGSAVGISSFSVAEGSDAVFVEALSGGLKVSALRSSTVRLLAVTSDGEEVEVDLTIKAPVMASDPANVFLDMDGTLGAPVNCGFRTTNADGNIPLSVGSSGAYGLDRTLYERYLQPAISVGESPLSSYLGVTGNRAYVAAYPDALEALLSQRGTLIATTPQCPDIKPVEIPVWISDPFPGLDGTGSLGIIRNVSLMGVAPWKKPSDGSLVYLGRPVEATGGATVSPAIPRSSFSFEDSGQFSFSLSDAGKLVLAPSGKAGYSAGKVPVAAIVNNQRTGVSCKFPLGYLDCYLYTQLGGILEGDKVSADLWAAPGVEAFSSLREVLSTCVAIRPDFENASFYLRNTPGNRVWTLGTEESLDGSYQINFETDAFMMSTWREAKGPGQRYALGETVYTIDLNPAMATVNEYSYEALMVWRTTQTHLAFTLSSHPSFSSTALGWHYAWGSERDASGRSYYVLVDKIAFFMQADAEPM